MGDQEMQFADPAWQPPQQRGINMATQQQEPLPQPVNVGTYEQPQWQDASSPQQSEEPYGHIGSYTDGYRAQSSTGIPLRTGQQKRRSPWLWIVLALIIFSLLGGAFRMNVDHPQGFPDVRMSDHFRPDGNAQQYQVQGERSGRSSYPWTPLHFQHYLFVLRALSKTGRLGSFSLTNWSR